MILESIRYDYMVLLYEPPELLLKENRKILKNLRKNVFNIPEAEIYDKILYIMTFNKKMIYYLF